MKATGIIRRIDDLGRVVIPKELRRTFGIANGDPVEIFTTAEEIVLRKYVEQDRCATCHGYHDDLLRLDSVSICWPCAEQIVRRMGS